MHRTRPTALIASLLLLAGCGGGAAATPEPLGDVTEVVTERTAEVTDGAPDVSSVPRDPDAIDVEYVQAVVDAINSVDAVAFDVLAEVRDLEHPDVVPLLASTRTPQRLHGDLQRLEELGVTTLPADLATPVTDVLEVTSTSRGCIHALAHHVAPPLHDDPAASQPHAVVLLRSAGDAAVNPTAWVVARVSATDLDDPCPT